MQLSKSAWALWVQAPAGEFCQRICRFYKPQTVLEEDFCRISVANILAQGEKKDLITEVNEMCNSELSQIQKPEFQHPMHYKTFWLWLQSPVPA